MAIPERPVWVFNGAGGRFPGGVFLSIESAEAWIKKHGLSGVLTAYPLDEGCFDWAVREAVTTMKPEKIEAHLKNPAFIGSFSSASQEHFHY